MDETNVIAKSAIENAVEESVQERLPEGSAFDPNLVFQIITFLMQFIQNCPFGQAKATIKEGGTAATVAAFNAVKKSGYTGNAVELARAVVARGKQASDTAIDETVTTAHALAPLAKMLGVLVAFAVCFASIGTAAAGPFPVLAAVSPAAGPFPIAAPQAPFPEDTTPVAIGDPPADSPMPVDTRPVLDVQVPIGDWCTICNWWKARDNSDLPMRLNFVQTDQQPKNGYPTFHLPRATSKDGRDWYIHSVGMGENVVPGLIRRWQKLAQPTADSLAAAEYEPTPHAEVDRVLRVANLQPHETFADLGCGDGRVLIAAVQKFNIKSATGVEIDPEQAARARVNVAAAGLSDRITIIEGDATKVDVKADVGYAYLFSDMLNQLKPKLTTNFSRFISYQHPVQGLSMSYFRQGQNTIYSWKQPQQTASVQSSGRVATWDGVQYTRPVCNGGSCTMCNSIRRQLGWQ